VEVIHDIYVTNNGIRLVVNRCSPIRWTYVCASYGVNPARLSEPPSPERFVAVYLEVKQLKGIC
jgi:hypothetical protein